MGVTFRCAWGSVLRCSMVSFVAARVRLVGRVVVGVGVPFAAKFSASCRMSSMVWAPRRAKFAAGAGFVRASARRLAASVAAPAEYMTAMALL